MAVRLDPIIVKEEKKQNVDCLPAGPVGLRVPELFDRLRRCWWRFALGATLLLVAVVLGAEYGTSRPSFCGSCHIMNRYHESWKKSKHSENGVVCIDCHYPPGEHHTIRARFKGLEQLFSCLGMGARIVQTAAFVSDRSCTTSECHSTEETTEEGRWLTNRIEFASYTRKDGSTGRVPFVHKTHFARENWLEDQEKHCGICHRHETAEHHMEVSPKTCNLCHFKNSALNEGRSKCSLCHEVPEKPFRDEASGSDELVTHKILEERRVTCSSCHLHHVRGTGVMRIQRCLECHENDQTIMEYCSDAELMHETHIATQAAHCSSCHETIRHGKASEEYDHFDATLSNCTACHAAPHHNKRLLISGTGGKGVDKPMPIEHHNVEMSCLACHIVDAFDAKGRKVKVATAGVCVNCHSKEEGALIEKWKSDVAEILEEAVEYEKEAVKTLELARGNVSEEAMEKAEKLLKDGQENLLLVNAGGGVHNKKYSALLLDVAIEFFEDAIAELEIE